MSKTKRGGKYPGQEQWSKRPGNGWSIAKAKKLFRGVERNIEKEEIKKQLKEE